MTCHEIALENVCIIIVHSVQKKKKKKKELSGFDRRSVSSICYNLHFIRPYEPGHDDKTDKVTVHPAKTLISLGIRPV